MRVSSTFKGLIALSATLAFVGCGGSADNSTGDAPEQSAAAKAANDAYVNSAGKEFMTDKSKGGSAAKKQGGPEAPR